MSTSQVDPNILFQLSMYSNLVNGPDPGNDPEELLYQKILAALKKNEPAIGKWKVAWGPLVVVPSDVSKFPINAMYVAERVDTPSQYVISIAGTNSISLLDWVLEDFLVSQQIHWPFDSGGDSAISLSTAIGLGILMSMAPSGDRPGAGLKLLDFLFRQAVVRKLDITTVGHSLGGALSPTVGLALANIEAWDPLKRAQVSSAPTAGATPGNQAFAQFLAARLPVQRYHNTLDVVPHAWTLTDLAQIPSLYANSLPKNIPPDPAVIALAQFAGRLAENGNYTQLQTSDPIAGTVDQAIITNGGFEDFLRQAGYQHVMAYQEHFAIPGAEMPQVQFFSPMAPVSADTLAAAVERGLPIPPKIAEAVRPGGTVQVPLGGRMLEIPASSQDPRVPEVVRTVQEELEKIAAWHPQSAAGA